MENLPSDLTIAMEAIDECRYVAGSVAGYKKGSIKMKERAMVILVKQNDIIIVKDIELQKLTERLKKANELIKDVVEYQSSQVSAVDLRNRAIKYFQG